jgi:flagellar hook-length control protein FliK
MEPALPPAPAPTSLRLTLTPPDQAITRRLAQASGNNKQISWAALLSGAKVSDVLAGATPVTNAAAAPLVAPGLPLPAALPAPATPLAMDAAPTGTPVSPALPTAQTLGASGATTKPDAINLPPAAIAATNAAALAAPAALALATNAAKTWENVHIEVPQGLDLEALQAERLAASDAEPSAPAAFASAAQSSAAPQNTAVVAKAEAATPQALAEQRAAHYQQLADRVGEAIAQRLIAQIERGQWKMQMRMQPGALGQIDVQLDMHAAGLDASFSADNAMTRELMAQGANRLRDALTEAGTTVASVWVNGDSSRQSGGNPTPGRNNQGPSSASAKKTADPSAATVAVTASNADSDGLNVLA